ncbi:progestin and adipoQ receptor family member 3-like [Planococcus citri]|uniref:progestin and adipoQ receptor family member 3-like n=1 Tax=Planococcus citri TaxID=170843 RepID=UPI0031F9CC72
MTVMNDEYSKNGVLQKRIINAEELDKNSNSCCENYRETSGSNCDNDGKHEKSDSSNTKHSIKLLSVCDVPHYLAFNQNIRKGYRSTLSLQQCIASIFWLTNETINIWSHLFGCFLFMGMLLYDLCLLNFHASMTDKFIVGGLLICFQGCMITSVVYHTFNCRSETHFHRLLKYDLYGISFSLLAIYLSGIYYAFWCNVRWCIFYSITVGGFFAAVMAIQIFSERDFLKIGIFVLWAAYGIIPTIHWMFTMGGWNNPIVQKLLPRVINMYAISGVAFLFYISYIPERFFPGRFDFIGSSHQAWHCLIVYALCYWHNTGIHYIEYRMNHSCFPM